MIAKLFQRKYGPIGIDVGSRSLKLVQFNRERDRVLGLARVDLPEDVGPDGEPKYGESLTRALRELLESRRFQNREAVVCLPDRDVYLQNVRVARAEGPALARSVEQEAAGRIPFAITDAELRFLEAADVRQGDGLVREVVLFACQRTALQRFLDWIEAANIRPLAVEVSANALARSLCAQGRREQDRNRRTLLVHVGYSSSLAAIAQGDHVLFGKQLPIGGKTFDATLAKHLELDVTRAAAVRRNNGDRRGDQQDPELARTIQEAVRPAVERLAAELSLCIRYHSVTFRGHGLDRLILSGGEASPQLAELLQNRLALTCQLSDPFRGYSTTPGIGRSGQWDIAAGLALWGGER